MDRQSIDVFADLEAIRLPPVGATVCSKLPRPQGREKFLKGPVPYGWLCRAAQLPGRALQVGLQLWFLAGLTRQNQIALSLTALRLNLGVSRSAAARGLVALEKSGLVRVQRQPGRKPVVSILQKSND